jgi:nucleoid-associated protein YgaU
MVAAKPAARPARAPVAIEPPAVARPPVVIPLPAPPIAERPPAEGGAKARAEGVGKPGGRAHGRAGAQAAPIAASRLARKPAGVGKPRVAARPMAAAKSPLGAEARRLATASGLRAAAGGGARPATDAIDPGAVARAVVPPTSAARAAARRAAPLPDARAKAVAAGKSRDRSRDARDPLAWSSEVTTYVVQPGDTLGHIAFRTLGSSTRWGELLAANRDRLTEPRRLPAYVTLRIPRRGTPAARLAAAPAPAARLASASPASAGVVTTILHTYTVRPGDSLSSIAASQLGSRFKWKVLWAANSRVVRNPAWIRPGQKLVVPIRVKPATTAAAQVSQNLIERDDVAVVGTKIAVLPHEPVRGRRLPRGAGAFWEHFDGLPAAEGVEAP